MRLLHGLKMIGFILLILFCLNEMGCSGAQPSALFRYEPMVQYVPSDSVAITPDAKYIGIYIPDNHRVHRGVLIFDLPGTVKVDSTLLNAFQIKHGVSK